MDDQVPTPKPGRPFDSADRPGQGEPASEGAYHAPPAQPSRDNRMAEPAVAGDGQMVEAGYGHGV